MDKSVESAKILNEEIIKSPQYEEYMRAKAALNCAPEIKSIYEDFLEAHNSYQLNMLNGDNPSFNERRIMSSKYGDVLRISQIKEFMEAKKRLADYLELITKTAFDNIDDIFTL